jgi:undecaprenyl-diphosphatase
MGITQGIAIIPGISRSGITIATLLFRKINRNTAFKFSFIVSIPAILGAVLLEARKIDLSLQHNLSNLFAGFVFSFLSGLCALWLLRLVMNKSKFHYFGYYCIGVAITTLIFLR